MNFFIGSGDIKSKNQSSGNQSPKVYLKAGQRALPATLPFMGIFGCCKMFIGKPEEGSIVEICDSPGNIQVFVE
jgi:hypothetical protein